MATRGRKPKPTALKVLEGNPGKRPLNKNEPQPERKAPRCPSWLEPEAKKEWKRMAKTLETIGVLTQVDKAAFAGYCQAYARWKEAEEFLSKHGTIFKTPCLPTEPFVATSFGFPTLYPYCHHWALLGQTGPPWWLRFKASCSEFKGSFQFR